MLNNRMQACGVPNMVIVLMAGAAMAGVGLHPAAAQYTSDNVTLHSQIDLATFGASSGNDCWGYTSPSGREYALMGLNNQVAFVEVTDPGAVNWFASVTHTSSTWGDIKVYQDVAYIVTETSGTGIQVVDLSDIDNHNVAPLQTLSAAGRNHNIAVDTVNGYLYTCGSRDGVATTVIFDLADPENPVQAGTWGAAYEHDAQIVTYDSGPYAGRQIMFGASEGRGLDVIDVTDKSNTFLMSRTPYPNVAYCHQVWTEDLQYLYINDELDSIPRTTVFDITDLTSPVMVGEFSSGLGAIDHNLYVKDGLIFEANYRSGLRIFDSTTDPINPPQVGWFDTYPENDNAGYDGAWSVYPFFASGTIIVSDIDRGLFVLEHTSAVVCSPPDCADGDACTTDTCVGGVCSYEPIDCDDSDACTTDSCAPASGCVNTLFTPCCGNGACELGEDCGSCSADCSGGSGGGCGDGICAGDGEDCFSCSADCRCAGGGGCNHCCGDGACTGSENQNNCPADCAAGFVPPTASCCGDDICDSGEDVVSCAVDCGCTVAADCEDQEDCTADNCVGGVCQNAAVADDSACNAGAGICCSGSCTTVVCSDDQECDNADPCSTDTCQNSGTCAASCDSQFPACQDGDTCCPPGCTFGNDSDCSCGGHNASCSLDTDCCSGNCKNNGKCSRP